MRQFASSGIRVWSFSREAKLVYTAFGLFSLLALASTALLYDDMVGAGSPTRVRAYYRGEHATAPAVTGDAPAGGPALELPDENPAAPTALTVAMPYRKLLEVTHFHLFTVPVFLLIVAHLFMLTGLSHRAKVLWIASAWLSALVHLAAPWLVRYGSASWAPLFPVSGGALALTATVLTAYPIVVMWRTPPTKDAAAKAA